MSTELFFIIKSCIKLNHSEEAYSFQRGEISLGVFSEICAQTILRRLIQEKVLMSRTKKGFKLPREFWIEFNGDPEKDKIPQLRFMRSEKFTPKDPSSEVIHFKEVIPGDVQVPELEFEEIKDFVRYLSQEIIHIKNGGSLEGFSRRLDEIRTLIQRSR